MTREITEADRQRDAEAAEKGRQRRERLEAEAAARWAAGAQERSERAMRSITERANRKAERDAYWRSPSATVRTMTENDRG